MSSGCGRVNGWCAGFGCPSSLTPTNIGKSTIHTYRYGPSYTGGRPRSLRKVPSTSHVVIHSSATMRMRSPGSTASAETSACCSESDTNFATGDSSASPSPTRIHTSPLAPSDFALSVSASSWFRVVAPRSGDADSLDRSGTGERLELGAREDRRELDEQHLEPEIGLVDAIAIEGLVPRHLVDRRRPLAHDRLGRVEHRLVDERHHVVLVDEARLGVELHELILAISPHVLVAEATGDLVVAIDAADHQQLLEELRALRQRVERTGARARRHEELAGTLGRRRHQHRRLDLDEALSLHRCPDRAVHLGADAEVALHPLATHVEIPIAKPDRLVDLVGALVDGERRWLGDREHLDSAVTDLDIAGGEVRVRGAIGARTYRAADSYHVLRPEIRGAIDDALHQPGVIADVDEREVLAVLAPTRHPSADGDLPPRVGCAELAAKVGALGHWSFLWSLTDSDTGTVTSVSSLGSLTGASS